MGCLNTKNSTVTECAETDSSERANPLASNTLEGGERSKEGDRGGRGAKRRKGGREVRRNRKEKEKEREKGDEIG